MATCDVPSFPTAMEWNGYGHCRPVRHFGDIIVERTGGELHIEQLRGNRVAGVPSTLSQVRLPARVFPTLASFALDGQPFGPRREWMAALDGAARGETPISSAVAAEMLDFLRSLLRPEAA